jgi:hypothetical protein
MKSSFIDIGCIRIGRERVVAEHKEGLHRIGLAFAHRPQQRRDMSGRQVGALPAEQLETISTEPLGIGVGGEVLDQARETAEAVHPEHPATRNVNIAGQRRQHRNRAYGLDAFRRVFDGAAPIQQGRLGAGEQARGSADLVGSYPGDRLGPFGCVLLHAFGKFGETVRPLRHEWFVIQLLADDDVEHRQSKRIVGARPDLQPEIGFFCKRRAARIDNDCPWVVRERLHHVEARLAVRSR